MSAYSGPEIANDGLVFAYDMGNPQKSWKGAPTVNLITNPTEEMSRGEFGQYRDLAPAFNTNGLVPYSLSMDMKVNKAGSVFVYMQNGSTTKYGFVSASVNATTEYQRFYFNNITPVISTPSDTAATLATYTGYGSGVNPTVKNIQLELGSFSTPFVNGTRFANSNLETVSTPAWNTQSGSSYSGGTLTFTSGSYNSKGNWDLYKTYSGVSTATNYTWSALVKLGTATNLLLTMNNTQAWNTGPSAQFNLGQLSTSEFRRISITGTTNFGSFNIHLGASFNSELAATVQSGGTVFIEDVRLELTGSQTALVDLTGNNTIAASSLTYASDNTFSFNGSNDKLTLNTNTLLSGAQNYTIDAVFKISASGADYIFGNYGVGNYGGLEYYVFQNKLNNYISGNTQSATNLVANQWYISSVVRNGTTITHYLNGQPDGSSTNGASITTNNPFTIGNGHNYTSEAFSGNIASVKVYNRALSAAEIQQNFNATRGRYGI